MKHSEQNLFNALFKWARRQEENYCTDALVWVINHLLNNEDEIGRRILSLLCFDEETSGYLAEGKITVKTQETIELDRPDVVIEADGFIAIVEVKVGAQLSGNQLPRYKEQLDKIKGKRLGQLILLERGGTDLTDCEVKPDHRVKWYKVAEWLFDALKEEAVSETSRFLISEFTSFMEDQGMTINRVGWELVPGMKAMTNLCQMLKVVGEEMEGVHRRVVTSYNSYGYWFDGYIWVGFYFSDPNELIVSCGFKIDQEIFKEIEAGDFFKENGGGEFNKGSPIIRLDLASEENHFFARSGESQKSFLRGFIEGAYNTFKPYIPSSDSGESEIEEEQAPPEIEGTGL